MHFSLCLSLLVEKHAYSTGGHHFLSLQFLAIFIITFPCRQLKLMLSFSLFPDFPDAALKRDDIHVYVSLSLTNTQSRTSL